MKITLSRFTDANGNDAWQVFIPGVPLCKETVYYTDKVTAESLARNMLLQEKGNELWFWDGNAKIEKLLQKN
jgi:hypothetical protein